MKILVNTVSIAYVSAAFALLGLAWGIRHTHRQAGAHDAAGLWFLRHLLLYLMALVAIIGCVASQQAARRADAQIRRDALAQVTSIADTIDLEQAQALSFTPDDRAKPQFQRLGAQMMAYAQATGLRSLYTMALREGNIVFGPESLAEDDPYASLPGTVYEKPSVEDFAIFENGRPIVQGPATDEYGAFITASAPVMDRHTGQVVMVVGIDIEADVWREAIERAMLPSILFSLGMMAMNLAGSTVSLWWGPFRSRHHELAAYGDAIATALTLVAVSAGVAWVARGAEQQTQRELFLALARAHAMSIASGFDSLHAQTDSVGEILQVSDGVNREGFATYAKSLLDHGLPYLWGWAPAVPATALEEFEAQAQREHLDGFTVWEESAGGGRAPAAQRPAYYPILYAESQTYGGASLGYDLGSQTPSRVALEKAARTGLPTSAEVASLTLGADSGVHLLAYQPVFQQEAPGPPQGFAVAALRFDTALRQLVERSGAQEAGISVSLFQLEAGQPPRPLAATSEQGQAEAWGERPDGFSAVFPVFILDRAYGLSIRAIPSFLAAQSSPVSWTVLVAGLLLALVMAAFVALEVNRRTAREREHLSYTAALRASEERYRTLFENAGEGVGIVDDDELFVYANPAAHAIFGVAPGQLVKHSVREFCSPEEFAAVRAQTAQRQQGEVGSYTIHILRPNGAERVLAITATPSYDAEGQFAGSFGIFRDVTEQQQAEEERLHLLRSALEQAAETIIIITDTSGAIQYVNSAFEKITGHSRQEALGTVPSILTDGAQEDKARHLLWEATRDKSWQGRLEDERKDGARFTVDAVISPVRDSQGTISHYVAAMRDITRELRLEEQVRQSQKIESVGRLAGGVAHDFNNMLQTILGFTELALTDIAPDAPVRESLVEIQTAARRSADLTRQLLAFARRQTAIPQMLDLNEAVGGMLKMLQRLIGEDIRLTWAPHYGLWQVKVDPSQIDQILVNLVVNARDAIAGVGTITIATGNRTLDELYCAIHPDAVVGDYVQLVVSDDGCGMDRETISHLFEPFFTTKSFGQGTGLGLATVFGIVKQNNGLIDVYSEPGHGAIFRIYLPRCLGEPGKAAASAVSPAAPRGNETILLVEDDRAILSLARMLLRRLGYTVLATGSPEEAIELARDSAAPIDLLLTDVVMPHMNGRDLLAQITTWQPSIACLFMSGYTADIIAHRGVIEESAAFLSKPFSIETLSTQVRAVLDGRKAPDRPHS